MSKKTMCVCVDEEKYLSEKKKNRLLLAPELGHAQERKRKRLFLR
jgi:hypothetical protein